MCPLIFLPGASGNTEFWQPLQSHFPQHHCKVIAYPSFAGTPNPQNIEQLTQHVLEKINEPCILIAQSMGGIFAVLATLKKPHLVKKLVLIATSGGINLKPFHVADWREDYHHQNAGIPNWFSTTKTQFEVDLPKIHCPTLLIWGDADPISPVTVGQYLSQQIKQSTLHIIQEGCHQLAFHHATQVAQHIQRFLK